MPHPQPSCWGSIVLQKMPHTLKKPNRANLQFLLCRLIRSQVARAEREWNLEQNCRKYLFPLRALPGRIFFALLLSQKCCVTHHCPTSQNCHSRRLGDPRMILPELLQRRHSHGLRRNPWKLGCAAVQHLPPVRSVPRSPRGHSWLCDTGFTSQPGQLEILAVLGDSQPFQA